MERWLESQRGAMETAPGESGAWPAVVQQLREGSGRILAQLEQAGLLELPLVARLADDLASALHCLDLLAAEPDRRMIGAAMDGTGRAQLVR